MSSLSPDICASCCQRLEEGDDFRDGDVDALGKLLADSDGATIARIPDTVLKGKVRAMGRLRCMRKEVRVAIKARLAEIIRWAHALSARCLVHDSVYSRVVVGE